MEQQRRKSDVEGIMWPPIATGEHAVLAALIARLEETERLPRAQLAQAQAAQLALLLAHHEQYSPSFTARLKAAGILRSSLDGPERLGLLPPLSRRDIQAQRGAFFSGQVPESHLPLNEIQTSGSTGEPVVVRRTSVNQLLWWAFTIRDYSWNARKYAGRMSSIRANVKSYVELRDWGPPVTGLYDTGQVQGIPITTDILKQLALVRRFEPEILLLYPSNLAAFVTIWEQAGFKLDSLRHVKTMGEIVSPSLRERTKAVTGLEIEDNYSAEEAGPIAIQCPASGMYHLMSEALIVEVLDPQGEPCREGQVGRVVVTDLHNFASPLIRYQIGDYAEVGGDCSCGRSLPTLRRVLGRERNLVVKPDGTRHWPLVGYRQYESVAPIRQFQLIQHSLKEIELRVVADQKITPPQEAALIAILQKSLNHPFDIRVVQFPERLPVPASGKFEEFVCMVS